MGRRCPTSISDVDKYQDFFVKLLSFARGRKHCDDILSDFCTILRLKIESYNESYINSF